MMLDIQDLHKTFGSNQVLKGITTTIDQGEVVVVIGHLGQEKHVFTLFEPIRSTDKRKNLF